LPNNDRLVRDGVLPEPHRPPRCRILLYQLGKSPARFAAGPAVLKIARQHLKQRQIPIGSGIILIDGFRFGVDGESLIETMKSNERKCLIVKGLDEGRLDPQRAVEPRQRLVIPAEMHQIVAETIADVRVSPIKLVRPSIVAQRFLEPAESIEHERSQMQCRRLTRPQSLAGIETDQSFIQPFQLSQQHAAVVGGIPAAGIDLEGSAEAGHRVCQASGLDEGLAEIAPQFRIVRLELHRFVEDLERIVMTSQVQQRGS
jgi:hypothetical protein